MRLVLAALIALGLGACASTQPNDEPVNVGDAKIAAREYRSSGAYDRAFEVVAAQADQWLRLRAPQVTRPALVLDVDETALSNWEVIEANDFGRFATGPCAVPEGPCGWAAWDQLGRSTPLPATVALVATARERGVAVFFITGRPESQREATERNLRTTGYDGFVGLAMVADGQRFASAADFKAPRRAAIEADGYTIAPS